ncbi:MAG: hypothetical protein ABI136_00005, partial [Ginsengibacter sp.]
MTGNTRTRRFIFIILLIAACLLGLIYFLFFNKKKGEDDAPVFKMLTETQTGIAFNNKLTESDSLNILNEANLYNGGGV